MSWAQKTILKVKDNYTALVASVHYLRSIYQLLLEQSDIEGTSYGGIITLVVGAPTTRINFTTDSHQNLPANAMKFVIPRKPLSRLLIASEGPADCEYKVIGNKIEEDVDYSDSEYLTSFTWRRSVI